MSESNHDQKKKIQNPNLLSPNAAYSQPQIVNTAGKVGKSHHEYLKVMADQKGVTNFRKITL